MAVDAIRFAREARHLATCISDELLRICIARRCKTGAEDVRYFLRDFMRGLLNNSTWVRARIDVILTPIDGDNTDTRTLASLTWEPPR